MKLFFGFLLILISVSTVIFAQDEPSDESDDIVKIETRLVSVPVLVSDRNGRFVSGLKENDFSIYQDGVKQEIAFFGDNTEPINVALLLDTSYSTSEVIDKIKTSALDFIKLLKKDDKTLIISFDTNVDILSELTSDKKELTRAINSAKVENVSGTIMRKTVNDVLNPLFAEVQGRKAIILLTDGKDFGSRISEQELLYNLEESDVIVYSIFYSTELNKYVQFDPAAINSRMKKNIPGAGVQRSPETLKRIEQIKKQNAEATEFLNKMSDITAGRSYERDITDLKDTFKIIVEELRNQYRIGFYPPDEIEKGKVHQLKVNINNPKEKNLVVRARKTYRTK